MLAQPDAARNSVRSASCCGSGGYSSSGTGEPSSLVFAGSLCATPSVAVNPSAMQLMLCSPQQAVIDLVKLMTSAFAAPSMVSAHGAKRPPTVTLRNGVELPMIAAGSGDKNSSWVSQLRRTDAPRRRRQGDRRPPKAAVRQGCATGVAVGRTA